MAHKVEYAGSFWKDLAKIAKREKKLENKVTKSERAGHQIVDLEKHRKWKKRWKEFCKYDHDWDSTFLYEIIIHKIALMREYFTSHSIICDEEKNAILEKMNAALSVGKRIMEDNYTADAFKFYESVEKGATGHMIFCKDGDEEVVLYKEYNKEDDAPVPSISSYYRCLKEMQEHAEKYKECGARISSFSEISDEDSQKFKDMLAQGYEKQKEDIKEFFNIIAENIESWWD